MKKRKAKREPYKLINGVYVPSAAAAKKSWRRVYTKTIKKYGYAKVLVIQHSNGGFSKRETEFIAAVRESEKFDAGRYHIAPHTEYDFDPLTGASLGCRIYFFIVPKGEKGSVVL